MKPRLSELVEVFAYVCLMTLVLSAPLPAAEAEKGYLEDKPHHLSVFLGASRLDDEQDTTGFTAGLDYEYRVSKLFGIGAIVEQAFGDVDALSALAVVDIHVYKGLAIQTGPGYEWVSAEEEEDRLMYRLGALYEFEVGEFTISPQLHYDFADGAPDTLLLGLAFGKAF